MFDERQNSTVKPFIIEFWRRDVGAAWLSFERKKIIEYSKIRLNEKVSVSGYVKWITSSVFALVPTLFSNQAYLLCVNCTDKLPSENSYIAVSGVAKLERTRPELNASNSTIFEGNRMIKVYDWVNEKTPVEVPKSYLSYDDFKNDLTRRFEDLEPTLKDFLAFAAISSPSFNESTGGINLTMYDSTKGQSHRSSLSRAISQEMKLAIPEGIGSTHTVSTSNGSFDLGYKYAFLSENADKPLSEQTETLLAHRKSRFRPDCTETSLSLFSAKNKPVTIEDLPCSLSDIPTVVPEKTSIVRKRRSIDPFDSFSFIVSSHFKTPVFEDLRTSLAQVADNLEKLASDYDLDPRHLTKYGFLNANYDARPMSVLRESLSFARARDKETVSSQLAIQVFNDFFKWNFKYVYEVWDDLLNKPLVGKRTIDSLRIKYREIIRIIRKYHSSRLLGVSRSDIIREAETSPLETEQLIDDCNNSGIIYQPVAGF
jgi:hypothetical protein